MAGEKQRFGIVVGVDGSAGSDVAVAWAAREAGLRKRRLTVVYAIATPVLPRPAVSISAEVRPRQEIDMRAVINRAVRIAADTIKDDGPVEIDSHLMFSAPVPTLVDMSEDADLVVVGARGLGSPHHILLGSVSASLIHHAHCPVAVIQQGTSPASRAVDAPVLLGIDGSAPSELATAIAFDEALLRGTRLVALHAWADTEPDHGPSLEDTAVGTVANQMLAARLAGWQERYPDIDVHRVVVYDRPAQQLLHRSETAQLVVVGSRGRGGFGKTMLGSVSAALAHMARTPVIVARSRGSAPLPACRDS